MPLLVVSPAIASLVAALPSPGSGEIGPFRAYGLMIALGVVAAVELGRRRWRQRGGAEEDIAAIAIWAVPAGLVGARLYHVITDWKRYDGQWLEALEIWNGGLGIPGGIAAGVVVGIIVGRRRGINIPVGLDMVAPCLPLAQAIGRLGNWFNQELYGRPTDLPWGLEIDPVHRVAGYASYATFHPTFLYEALWNLALCGFLVWIDSKRILRPGRVFVLYVMGYALGRLWVELVRIDPASLVLGVRVNVWMSLLLLAGSLAVFVIGGVRRRPGDDDAPYVSGPRERGAESGGGRSSDAPDSRRGPQTA